MNRSYTIPELDSLWSEVESLKTQLAELHGRPEILRAAAARAATIGNVLVSQREAAAILSVSQSTVEQLIAQGDIQVRRIGKRVLVPRKQLDRLADRDLKVYWPSRKQGRANQRKETS